MKSRLVLLFGVLAIAHAADESCMDRCENGFDSRKSCQCDFMCKYYKSCCLDYETICRMTMRGDTFFSPEDDDNEFPGSTPAPGGRSVADESVSSGPRGPRPRPTRRPISTPVSTTQKTTQPALAKGPEVATPVATTIPVTTVPTPPVETTTREPDPDPDAKICSGRPFDSFMQLKNGTIYAFRGDYFFELDQKSVLPGYPKRIKDVWGIHGPIDAAFTRVNCQGKTYIFKRNLYWRFEDGVLDEDYPREISVGFDKIPDNVDAAFALPAPSHHGKEKVFFFKGDEYYVHEFLHQPSHEECITMTGHSPSALFMHYTDMYQSFPGFYADMPHHHSGHKFINKDWKGIRSPVNAVLAGRIYVRDRRDPPPRNDYRQDPQQYQQYGRQDPQQYQHYAQQWELQQSGRRRQYRSPFWETIAERAMARGQDFAERGMDMGLRMAEQRMDMEQRLHQAWNRGLDQARDQDRRGDGYRLYNTGNYQPRPVGRDDRAPWESIRPATVLQSVYFFKGDKYSRVDVMTKRVDPAFPPYPRSIAKYWLGCSDPRGTEKK